MVVCGANSLTYRLAEELTTRYGEQITVVVPSRRDDDGPDITRIPGVTVVRADRLETEVFRHINLGQARVLALTDQDDVGNIHAALCAKEVNPNIRLVVRMFNMKLGQRIRELFEDCAVLSDAAIAAPAFVTAALGDVAPSFVPVAGRTLYVARSGDVDPDSVVCVLASQENPNDDEELLPADPEELSESTGRSRRSTPGDTVSATDAATTQAASQQDERLVLAVANTNRPATPRRRYRYRSRDVFWPVLRALLSRRLGAASLVLIGVLLLGSVLYATLGEMSWLDALYVTLLTASGRGDPDITLNGAQQAIQTMIVFAGIAVIPVVTAAVVNAVVGARLAINSGLPTERLEDHVVVVGMGNVGSQIMTQLDDLGLPLLAVDRRENAPGIQVARQRGIPVLIGDTTVEQTLQDIQIERARALVAVTSDDIVNLETALHARALRRDLRVVLRLFDGDFARRAQRRLDITASRSVAYLAAPAFAAAMVERNVISTLPVGNRVLLVAEFPVGSGSELDGRQVREAHLQGHARVIALGQREGEVLWRPASEVIVRGQDRLFVLATREGLGELLARTTPLVEMDPSAS